MSNIVAPQFTAHTATLVALVAVTVFSAYRWYKEYDTVKRIKSGAERAKLQLDHEIVRHREVEKIQSQFIAGSQNQTHKKRETEHEPPVSQFDGQREDFT